MCDPTAYCFNISRIIKKEKVDKPKEVETVLHQPQKRTFVTADGVVLKKIKLIPASLKKITKPIEPVHQYDSEIIMHSPPPLSPIEIIDNTQNTEEMIAEMFPNMDANTFNNHDSQDTQNLFKAAMLVETCKNNQNNVMVPETEEVQIMMQQYKKKQQISQTNICNLKKLKLVPATKVLESVHRPSTEPKPKIIQSSTSLTPTQISHASQLNNPELKFIATQLAALRLDISRNNNLIRSVLLDDRKFKMKLPLEDVADVAELSIKIEEDRDEIFVSNLIKYLSKYEPVEKCYASSGLTCIMTDELLALYNWDGQKQKIPMKDLLLFKKIIYEAWKSKYNNNHHDYEMCLKKQIAASHNRFYQKKSRKLQQNKKI